MEVRESGDAVLPEALRSRVIELAEAAWERAMSGECTAAQVEEDVAEMSRRVGCEFLSEALSERFGRHEGPRRGCECGESQRFERYQVKGIHTVLGDAEYERAYYRCGACKATHYVGDAGLGITGTSYTLPAQEVVSLLCSDVPFASARNHLKRLAGLSVSISHLQDVSEGHGAQIEALLGAEQEALFSKRLELVPEARPERLYVSLDGTMTPFQDGWHETRIGAVYEAETNKRGEEEAARISYVGGVQEDVKSFGRRVYQEASRRGLHFAKEVVVVADGAPWIWNLAAEHFKQRVEILDFYHAGQRLHDVGKAVYGESSPEASRFAEVNKAHLIEGRMAEVFRSLHALQSDKPHAQETVRLAIGYFEKNRARMRYDYFRSQGYHIGSGVVEAGCKHVAAQRCKRSGQRWSKDGAQNILSLRCLMLSDRWDDHWGALKSAA
jgi:hypothetical protein